ncbi:MAG: hypothetical protein WBN41_06835 [Lysobacterales bacterium]
MIMPGGILQALETDQFYAWGKPIDDSSHYLNAWIRLQIQDALDSKVNKKPRSCEAAINIIQKRLQHSIYQPIEIWINSTNLVDRVPRGLEEYRDYRNSYLLSKTVPLDTARGLQPSPTLEVNDIRFGSDKLAHFFSEGWWYYNWWQKNKDSAGEDELKRNLLLYGIKLEKWVQGELLTGVISPADMEANYQGFIFYQQLCNTNEPLLYQLDGRWHFSDAFDISNYVMPEWDESWNANIYSKLRWKGIRQTMMSYCPMLQSDWVKKQRAHYAAQNDETPTEELIRQLVAAGELPDPHSFDIVTVCEQTPQKLYMTPQ